MGRIVHDTLMVTSWNGAKICDAHYKACDLGLPTSFIKQADNNGYRSFVVFTCGSKVGWSQAEKHESDLDKLVKWIDEQAYEDGSNALNYARTVFGECDAKVTSNTDNGEYED